MKNFISPSEDLVTRVAHGETVKRVVRREIRHVWS
jgi:hypothetical protein